MTKTTANMKTTTYLLSFLLACALGAAEPTQAKRLTAAEVANLWNPQPKPGVDLQRMGGPQDSGLAAYSFRVAGPTYGELWNHYAELCGMKERFAEEQFLNSGGSGPKGRFLVLDRVPGALGDHAIPGRGLSMFVLKTDSHTVTVTFHPSPDGRSILGSLTAMTLP